MNAKEGEQKTFGGIVSKLDEKHSALVEEIWEGVRTKFGVVDMNPLPHISYQVVESYLQPKQGEGEEGVLSLDDVCERLAKLAAELPKFKVRTSPIGIFVGEIPRVQGETGQGVAETNKSNTKKKFVVHLPVVRTEMLSNVHKRVWEAVEGLGKAPQPYYHPDHWFPHITLAQGETLDDNPALLGELVAWLAASWKTNWEIEIDSLSVLQSDGKGGEVAHHFTLQHH